MRADLTDLDKAVEMHFTSDLFNNLTVRRRELVDYAVEGFLLMCSSRVVGR